jgi:hypothetical protein
LLKEIMTAIQEHTKLAKVKQLQAFLGVVNFYCSFVPSAAKILQPLAQEQSQSHYIS